jgi:membrane associated rhomboid family serine protease
MFNVPVVILAMIAVLGLVHAVFVLVLTKEQTTDFLILFSFIPARYSFSVLAEESWVVGWGAAAWTFLTYAFIHGNLNHLAFNLLWLLAFGTPVARRFGALRFIGLCTVTAAAGAGVHLATHWGETAPMVGASAAISGAMAAAMRFAFQRGGPLGVLGGGDEESYRVPALSLSRMLRDPRVLIFLAVWLGVNLLFGLGAVSLPGVEQAVAWQAHVGGFLAGLLLFGLFDPVRHSDASGDEPQPIAESPPNERSNGNPTLH